MLGYHLQKFEIQRGPLYCLVGLAASKRTQPAVTFSVEYTTPDVVGRDVPLLLLRSTWSGFGHGTLNHNPFHSMVEIGW